MRRKASRRLLFDGVFDDGFVDSSRFSVEFAFSLASRKVWFYQGKTMIFEVLEVLGNDLETLSEMETAERAFERGLRVPFCRFGEILEILRVPLGGHLGSKI